MIVPHQSLNADTLKALIEEFVTRQGAVHGHSEASLDAKIAEVLSQLKAGKIVIVYDETDDSCTIATREAARQL